MSSHQAIMKCPWQWRQPFLDEKRESRKRKVGDGYFYDPVDPNFVDHLLPGYAKKFCGADVLESDEKENIQREIERLMTKKTNDPLNGNDDATVDDAAVSSDKDDFDVSRENQALVDSILQMSKSRGVLFAFLDEGSDDDDSAAAARSRLTWRRTGRPSSSRPQLVARARVDNLQETLFAVEDSELLDFQGTGVTEAD
ncbi:hypothetical protein GQ600_23061 [Phytophthora cactorum]|nr:hypothetical protein GQ600_23061 [Phytophthora cactorum]